MPDTVDGTRGYFFNAEGQPAFEVDVWPLDGGWAVRITEIGVGPIATEPDNSDVHKQPTEAEAMQWAQRYLEANRSTFFAHSYKPLWEPLRYNINGTPALL